MDKNQELRTNLVLEAHNALTAVKELSDGLDKIANLKFDNVKQGFNSLTKAFEAAQKMSSKVSKAQVDDEKSLQNLLKQRSEIIKKLQDDFTKQKTGLKVKVDVSEAQQELQRINRMVADMYVQMGQNGKARSVMKEAISLLTSLENAGFKNTGLQQAMKEFKDIERTIQSLSQTYKKLQTQVANGLAEKARQDAVKKGENPLNNPVYANSELGKQAMKVAEEKAKVEKQANTEAERSLQVQKNVLMDIAKLYKEIESHRGKNGQSYSKAGYENALKRIEDLRGRATDAGLHGDAALLSPALLNGVNTRLGQFNNRLSEAKNKAEQLYMKFRETRTEADRLSFLKAKNDFQELNRLADDFNKAISKAARHDLNISNIAKRAKEHFNWTAGAYVENKILDFPQSLISDVSKYELAMAGVAQVLPKAEQGQAALNEQFRGFAETAARYGQNVESVVESAKSIGRMYGQGDGNADVGAYNTQLLAQQAAKMATVDNFDMLEATKGLESALAQFNLQTEDSNLLMQRSGHILDVWTKLAHTSGASAQDLTQGVNKAGAAAHQAGISFEFLNALIASGVRATAENGGIIGNSLKSMFSSILSDKNIKNMERYGVEIYKIGNNGKKELREMQDIIMDISRILGNPSMDTKGLREFLMSISGGKQQYSRVMAILGNPKELERTLNLANNSSGFTNKQLELQLDTVSRKFETLKANVTQLFVNSGADGLANDLKWILDCLNRLTHALATGDTHFYKWAKYGTAALIAWKAIPALIGMATKAVARFNVAKQGGSTARAMSEGILGGFRTDYQAELDKQRKRRMQKSGIDVGEMRDAAAVSAAWDKYTQSVQKNTLAQRINNQIATATLAGAKTKALSLIPTMNSVTTSARRAGTSMTAMKGSILGWLTALGRGTGMMRVLTTAIGVVGSVGGAVFTGLRGAIGLLGGPVGAAITAFSLLGMSMASQAVDADLAKEKYTELSEAIDNLNSEIGDEMEKMAEQSEKAQGLAEQYNGLVDKLKELQEADDGSTESAQRQNEVRQEMGRISSEIQEILHANAIEFDEDGKINKETVQKLAEANHQEATEKLNQTMAKVSAEKWATDESIKAVKARINGLAAEANSTSVVSAAYRAMYKVITLLKESMIGLDQLMLGIMQSSLGGTVLDAVFGKNVVDSWIESTKERINAGMKEDSYRNAQLADPTNLWNRTQMAEAQAELKQAEVLSESLNDQWNGLYALGHGLSYDKNTHEYKARQKINPTKENPNEGKTATEPQERGGKGRSGGRKSGSGRESRKKEDFLYDDDSSKSFSKASKHINQSYSDKGVDVAKLQAIANALNGGSYAGVADPFHNGGKNPWDSSYNFSEQLKKQFQSGEDLYTALDNIFKGWGIAWNEVIDKNAKELQDKYNYKKRDKYFKDPTESGKTTGGGDNLGYFDSLMNDSKFGHMANAWVGLNQCVVSSLKASALVSSWAADMSRKGYANVDRLYEEAVNDPRVEVKKYSDAEAKTGDIVLYVDGNGERQHAGVIAGRDANGKVINYDDSSSAKYHFIRRGTHDLGSSRIPAYIIHDKSNIVANGGGKPASRWNDGGDGLAAFEQNSITELVNQQKKAFEIYEIANKRLELERKMYGDTADISKEYSENMNALLGLSLQSLALWERAVADTEQVVTKYLNEHPAVLEKVGGSTEGFFALSDSAKQELAQAAKDKQFETAVKNFITAQKNFSKATEELRENEYKVRQVNGYMSPSEKYEYLSSQNSRKIEKSKDHDEKVSLAQQNYRLAVAEKKRLDEEYTKACENNRKKINEAEEEVYFAELKRKKILADYDAALSEIKEKDAKKRAKAIEDLTKQKEEALKDLDATIKRKREEIADRKNGDKGQRDAEAASQKAEDELEKAKEKMEEVEQEFRKAGANVSTDFFDKLLFQGKKLKDVLKDIQMEIAKIALKRAMNHVFGVKNKPLQEEGDIGMILSGIGGKRKKTPAPFMPMQNKQGAYFPYGGGYGDFSDFRYGRPTFGWQKGVSGRQQNALGSAMEAGGQAKELKDLSSSLKGATDATKVAAEASQAVSTTGKLVETASVAGKAATAIQTTATTTSSTATTANTATTTSLIASNTALIASVNANTAAKAAGGIGTFLSTGGKIPGFATGGFTDGLIRGAGSGTSDSILTYLAHRGQFIATSNGEYIIKKSSVDKLGVGFLDTLNNNPEAIGALQGLKRYASGGNLGETYAPSMTMKGIEGYKTFNKSNMEKQMSFSTRKMETLLQGLREDVQDGNKGDRAVTQPVILNTQADSASVMKAIAKNPRAIQKLLGRQQRHGFRG